VGTAVPSEVATT